MRTATLTLALTLALALALGALVLGCDDEPAIGAPCGHSSDCEDGRCVTGGDFPDGLCTYECRDSRDCPGGWQCIDKSGGICMELCRSDAECRDHFGSRWECSSKKNKGEGGESPVCIGD